MAEDFFVTNNGQERRSWQLMAHPGQPGVLNEFGHYQKAWSRLRLTVGNTTTTGQYTRGPRGPFFPRSFWAV